MEFLKKAHKTPATDTAATRRTVDAMLAEMAGGGAVAEAKARHYARTLDKFDGEIVINEAQKKSAAARLPAQLKEDIARAHGRIRRFAEAQLESLGEFQTELSPGLTAGQRLLPVSTAGCYVPGGRYAHVASALMSITTAKVAGVAGVVACSPPNPAHVEHGVHPAILHAMVTAGADRILAIGGVQGVAALAFGLFTGRPADIIAGPGNRFVAEAKRALYGRVGIDLFAGPTEILVIADATADPDIVAADLVGQAEHGADSPAWLVATDAALAKTVTGRIAAAIARLPEPNRTAAADAWRDYGEVALAADREQAAAAADRYAAEHVEVHAADHDFWLRRLQNYGSLFLGEETTVAFGDKTAGPNHILPTRGAARYTGGLSVGKFLKTVTWQRMTRAANRDIAAAAARISRLEGMEGHALTCDARLRKYFDGETFDTAAS